MQFVPYLSFQGQAAEAFAAYGRIFGAAPHLNRFSDIPPGGDAPPLPEEQRAWVMHAQLTLPDGGTLMGADMPPQFGDGEPESGARVSVSPPTIEEARRLFGQLAEGGTETMPFGETFFSKGFGMCRDRFGVQWMVSVAT